MPNYPAEYPAVFIRGKEIDCWFSGILFERHIDGLVFQYDTGLKLNIRGLDTESINQVEFTRSDSTDGAVAYTVAIVDPLAASESASDPSGDTTDDTTQTDTGTDGDGTNTETTDGESTSEETEIQPEDKPYLSVSIPDELLTKPGTVIAYCTYNGEGEYRTVKAVYITVHERQALKVEEPAEETSCGCTEQIAALQETIAALTERITALENAEDSSAEP